MSRIFTLLNFTIGLGLVLIGLVLFYLLYPYQPVELIDDPIPVLTKEVKRGDPVTIKLNFIKNSDMRPNVSWFMVDGFVTKLADGGISRPLGENVVTRNMNIPRVTQPGDYHLRVELDYKVNPLRTISYSWDSETFTVVE